MNGRPVSHTGPTMSDNTATAVPALLTAPEGSGALGCRSSTDAMQDLAVKQARFGQ